MKQNKNIYFKFCLTPLEKKRLENYATLMGITMTEAIRERCKDILEGDELLDGIEENSGNIGTVVECEKF